jgi:hypothetical protein
MADTASLQNEFLVRVMSATTLAINVYTIQDEQYYYSLDFHKILFKKTFFSFPINRAYYHCSTDCISKNSEIVTILFHAFKRL